MLYIFKFNDTMFEHHTILVFRRKLKSSRTEEEGDVKDFRIVGEGGGWGVRKFWDSVVPFFWRFFCWGLVVIIPLHSMLRRTLQNQNIDKAFSRIICGSSFVLQFDTLRYNYIM